MVGSSNQNRPDQKSLTNSPWRSRRWSSTWAAAAAKRAKPRASLARHRSWWCLHAWGERSMARAPWLEWPGSCGWMVTGEDWGILWGFHRCHMISPECEEKNLKHINYHILMVGGPSHQKWENWGWFMYCFTNIGQTYGILGELNGIISFRR